MAAKKKGTGKAQSKAKAKDEKKPKPKASSPAKNTKSSSPASKPKATRTASKPKATVPKAKAKPKTTPAPTTKKNDEDIDLRTISKQLTALDKSLEKISQNVKDMKDENRANNKRLKSLETKLETRIKREELIMDTLGLNSHSKKGGKSEIRELNSSLIKSQEYLLNTGNRIDNILSAIKNHREFLVKLNRRVYKVNAREIIELQVDIISNSLTVMMLTGFDFDKSLIRDVDKLKKMMEAKEFELGKVKKKMTSLDKKFEEELERFDFKSIYEKKQDIPGYH